MGPLTHARLQFGFGFAAITTIRIIEKIVNIYNESINTSINREEVHL